MKNLSGFNFLTLISSPLEQSSTLRRWLWKLTV